MAEKKQKVTVVSEPGDTRVYTDRRKAADSIVERADSDGKQTLRQFLEGGEGGRVYTDYGAAMIEECEVQP